MSYSKLLIWQYKGKPKAQATAALFDGTFGASWDGIASLPEALDIATATGVNLDLVGKHVGQSRILTDLAPRELFGFEGVESAKGFRLFGSGGGRFYRAGSPLKESVVLNDEDYRFLIRCRIAKNYMAGTIENITDALNFIFDENSAVYDQYNMSITVVIRDEQATPFKRYAIKILDILPRPAGVGVEFYSSIPVKAFGFFGAKDAAGFNAGKFARYL